MIAFADVHKRYWTTRGEAHWALRGVTFTLPPKVNLAVLGGPGSGKSTLLRLVGGIDRPTLGEVRCERRVSWPIGSTGGLQNTLTGRQNARFICRVQGCDEAQVDERIGFVERFSELGDAFTLPVSTYTKRMRARLSFALSVAFDFDVYLVDERLGAGSEAVGERVGDAMRYLASRGDLIVASQGERLVRSLCQAAVCLHEGRAYWFDSIKEAFREYSKMVPA